MYDFRKPDTWWGIASVVLVLVGLLLVFTSCSLRTVAGSDAPGAVPGDTALATTVNRLAFVAGLAAIGIVAAGIFLKQYAAALIGGPALAGLALVFLLLPALAAAVKWLLIGSVILCVAGAARLAWTRWKMAVALKLTAKHADRMEAAETVVDVDVAKEASHTEQVEAGVAKLIERVRGA